MHDWFLIVEGDVDRALLEALVDREVLKFPKDRILPRKGDPKGGGRDKAIERAQKTITERESQRSFLKVALLLDLDQHTPSSLQNEIAQKLQGQLSRRCGPFPVFAFPGRNAELLLFYAGAQPPQIRLLGRTVSFQRSVIEDCLFRLLRHPRTYQELQKSEKNFRPYSQEEVFQKLLEIRGLLNRQGMALMSSKDLLGIWKEIVGLRFSPATLAERLVEKAPENLLRAVFKEWIRALAEFFTL